MTLNALHDSSQPLAVLVSGGVDSAVLVGDALTQRPVVQPIYVRTGSAWEPVEHQHLQRYLKELHSPRLRPLVELEQPVADLYGAHWSMTGREVPGYDSPDEAVYLPGRNVMLLAKALIWCHLNQVPELALAPLAANPFPDATPAFFTAFQDVVNRAIEGRVQVLWPYLGLNKVEVMRRGRSFPLQYTFSCMNPRHGRHCGACNKCAERRRAFRDAGLDDPTEYAS